MNLDEALDYVEGAGPLGDFAERQKLRKAVEAAFRDADVAYDAARLARVRRLVHKAGDYNIQSGITWCWVRAELALGNAAAVATAILASPYADRFFIAGHLTRSGIDAWPLARLLIEHTLPPRSVGYFVAFVSELIAPAGPDSEARFAELCSLSTSLAARALSQLPQTSPIAGRLSALLPRIDSSDGGDVVDALVTAAQRGESLAAIEPSIDDKTLSGPRAEDVACALTLSAVRDERAAPCVTDSRPAVRLGAVRTLANDPRLIGFVRDSDRAVRRAAIVLLGQRGITADEIAPLVSALEIAGTPLADLLVVATDSATLIAACTAVGTPAALALAASLQRQQGAPTRACAICKPLPRDASWSHSSDTPVTLGQLVTVSSAGDTELLRCPSCSACYASSYWSDVDVNSMNESWTLRRFTLGELTRDHGPGFVPDWSTELVADLGHPDPHWRSEAAYDLATDLVNARQFDRIENELLRHASIDVPRETLRVLRGQAIDAPVSAAVLEALAASVDDDTRSIATTLLAVQRGARALEEMPLDSVDDHARADLLLAQGVAASPAFVARLLDRALTEPFYTWTIDSAVDKVAFTPEHLPATRARLRAALVVGATRQRALRFAETLARRALLDDETRTIALRQFEAELEATLHVALADDTQPLPPALVVAALRVGGQPTTNVVQRLTAALDDDNDVRWAVPALAANVRSFPESYDTSPLLDELAKRGTDLTDAVSDLTAALDSVMGYSEQYAARALVRHHMRRGETDAVLALLSHPLPTVRGSAAGALGAALPPAIIARLQAMTTEPAWYPRGEAASALRAGATSG